MPHSNKAMLIYEGDWPGMAASAAYWEAQQPDNSPAGNVHGLSACTPPSIHQVQVQPSLASQVQPAQEVVHMQSPTGD